ncbi:MAG: carboxylating nicotinate-nucleotide diphosphorylase [Acidobacteria bacterium]|nr:carboxylating nicotinate-nucleotide diphosphorylase [Acidobacteriota bacterium]
MILPLDPDYIYEAVERALLEDLGRGDITSRATIRTTARGIGSFLAKQDLVLAGIEVADAVFSWFEVETQIQSTANDGDEIKAGKVFARVTGEAQTLLAAERTALNFLQHLSGIATKTKLFVDAIAGTEAQIVDTRKTVPGLRMLEKYAVTCGGGRNHRIGLDDGVLIKDNHIALAGGIEEAVRRAREIAGHLHKIEVETASLEQVNQALKANADIIMLDNMTPDQVRECVAVVKDSAPEDRRALTEASGGITLDNVRAYAEAGVDLISIGAITHSAPAVDISFKIKIA